MSLGHLEKRDYLRFLDQHLDSPAHNFECDECDKSFRTQHSLDQHLDSPAHNFECDECDKSFRTQRSLDQHLDSPAHNFECDECGRTFKAERSLVQHRPHRLPVWTDETNLPYVRALIKEVHRWAPIGSLGIPHATSKTDVVDGRTIPNGTIVFPNLTALSRDSDRYQDPDTFEPDRFLGDNLDASSSALHPDHMKRDHFHYGFGRRLCQGIFVAEASLYIVVSRVLWGFDIKPVNGASPLDMDAKISGLVTKPKPYKVSTKSRGPQFENVIRQSMQGAKTDILNFDDVAFTG